MIIGFIFGFKPLVSIGIILFAAVVLFHIITLPVEYNASSRAIRMLENAGILTATSLSLGIVGVAYNAWLTRNLGSSGMGLFSLMMAVYRFAVTFACSGSGLAATRLVAEENARKNNKFSKNA